MRVRKSLWWGQGVGATSVLFVVIVFVINAMVLVMAVDHAPHLAPMFMAVLVVHRAVWLFLRYQILSELGTTLVYRNCMSNDSCAASGSIWKPTALHPCIFKGRNTIDSIEKAEKANWFHRTAECLSEGTHELEEFVLLRLLSRLSVFPLFWESTLPLLKCSGSLVSGI
jgi:hypothetical protein